MAVDDAAWTRGRGWALWQAIVALPYYVETNKVMADTQASGRASLSPCLLYTSPSPRDGLLSRMPSSA